MEMINNYPSMGASIFTYEGLIIQWDDTGNLINGYTTMQYDWTLPGEFNLFLNDWLSGITPILGTPSLVNCTFDPITQDLFWNVKWNYTSGTPTPNVSFVIINPSLYPLSIPLTYT